jgi:hypothetical protein
VLAACNAFREDLRNYKLVFPERSAPGQPPRVDGERSWNCCARAIHRTVNFREQMTKSWLAQDSRGRFGATRFRKHSDATAMFFQRPRSRVGARLPSTSAPAPVAASGLPDTPSLEGYTIQELRTGELARLIKFDELEPEQVASLIRVITGKSSAT